MFTYFKAPVKNTIPYNDITLADLYKAIKGNYFKAKTEYLRGITDRELYRKEKSRILDYVTFAGTFNCRKDDGLKELSGLMCIDFDHIPNIEFLKRNIIKDKSLLAQMVFVSPGGDGLKVVLSNPYISGNYRDDYKKITAHISLRYGIRPDATQDPSRACFICHDPIVWVSQEVHLEKMIKKNPAVGELINKLD